MLKLILGRAGSGKTEYIRRMLADHSLAGKGGCVLLVLHELAFALRYSDRMVLLDKGRLAAAGAPRALAEAGWIDRVFGVRTRLTDTGCWFEPKEEQG